MLEVFNTPSPDFSCELRGMSTVTPQVFSLFNGRSSHARALALADRVLGETATDQEAVQRCFQLLFSRDADPNELQLCVTHWQQMMPLITDTPAADRPPLTVRREAIEENTGERFAFDERLHAYEDFVADLQPEEVDARTRALAELCLVLLNTNEFIYVY